VALMVGRRKDKRQSELPGPEMHGTRAQAVHRLQLGLAGLFAMLLLVGLASTIMEQARDAEVSQVTQAGVEKPDAATDPLVDIGVVPELPAEEPQPSPQVQGRPSGQPVQVLDFPIEDLPITGQAASRQPQDGKQPSAN
jgi:hypothetical protein